MSYKTDDCKSIFPIPLEAQHKYYVYYLIDNQRPAHINNLIWV